MSRSDTPNLVYVSTRFVVEFMVLLHDLFNISSLFAFILQEWVHHQRNRRNTMPKDKVEKLEQIGFKWLTRARPMKRKKLSDDVRGKNRGSSAGDDNDDVDDEMDDEPNHQPFHRSHQRPLVGFGTPARQWL